MPKILDPELYQKAKMEADKIYKVHGAFKSGFIVKKYKELGGRYGNDGQTRKLTRWFDEKWKDVGNKSYPVYRPTVKVSKDTPLTVNEIDKANLKKQINLKQRIKHTKNLPKFKPKN